MGIPGLFANLSNKYKKQIIKIKNEPQENGLITTIDPIDMLFFDFNCLIHPICRLVWMTEYKNKTIDTIAFEQRVMEKTIEYLELKIKEINPTKLVGIFIDGVCPMSKIVQQRQRRFASILDKEVMNNIRHKHGVTKDEYYDTNAITPGTVFMENFNKFITNYIILHNDKADATFKFVYSSYKEVGEGEHKIIKYIKNHVQVEDNIVIYGLDADLIILSMTLAVRGYRLYLYREHDSNMMSLIQPMIYFDINECVKMLAKDLAHDDIKDTINLNDMTVVTPYIIDFVFITLLLGNDFLISCPTLNMRFNTKQLNGYDTLMIVYKSLHVHLATYDYVNNKINVDWTNYKELINRLATFEEHFFVNQSNHRKYGKTESVNPADIQIFRMEHLMFKFPDPLKMSDQTVPYDDRKKRFVHHYFGSSVCKAKEQDNSNSNLKKSFHSQLLLNSSEMTDTFYNDKMLTINMKNYDKIMETYLGTMSYIMSYYFNECPDYEYYYKHMNSPLLSDLYEYLNTTKDEKLNTIMDTFATNKQNRLHITPIMQLMFVLPVKSFSLLPKNMYKLLNETNNVSLDVDQLISAYKSYFPKNPKRDFLHKNKLFQASLVLDMPDIHLIIALLTCIKVSADEESRNEIY